MQARERATLVRQMLTETSCGPATVWRCALCLAVVVVVTLLGTVWAVAQDGMVTAARGKPLRTLDNARPAGHRKDLFDARRLRFQQAQQVA